MGENVRTAIDPRFLRLVCVSTAPGLATVKTGSKQTVWSRNTAFAIGSWETGPFGFYFFQFFFFPSAVSLASRCTFLTPLLSFPQRIRGGAIW